MNKHHARPAQSVIGAMLGLATLCSGWIAESAEEIPRGPRRAIHVLAARAGTESQQAHSKTRHEQIWRRNGDHALKKLLVHEALITGRLRGHGKATTKVIRQASLEGLADLLALDRYQGPGWAPAFQHISGTTLDLNYRLETLKTTPQKVLDNLAPTEGFTRMMTDTSVSLLERYRRFEGGVRLMRAGAHLVEEAHRGGISGLPKTDRAARLTWAAAKLGIKKKGTSHQNSKEFVMALAAESIKAFNLKIFDGTRTRKLTAADVDKNRDLRDELARLALVRRHVQRVDAILPAQKALERVHENIAKLLAGAETQETYRLLAKCLLTDRVGLETGSTNEILKHVGSDLTTGSEYGTFPLVVAQHDPSSQRLGILPPNGTGVSQTEAADALTRNGQTFPFIGGYMLNQQQREAISEVYRTGSVSHEKVVGQHGNMQLGVTQTTLGTDAIIGISP